MVGLILSFSDNSDNSQKFSLINKAELIIKKLTEQNNDILRIPDNHNGANIQNCLILGDHKQFLIPETNLNEKEFFIPLTKNFYSPQFGYDYSKKENFLSLELNNINWIKEIAPPFAVFYKLKNSAAIIAATDIWGLKHIYVIKERNWSAISTSSLLLGILGNDSLDWNSLITFSQAGFLLGDSSFFQTVKKLDPGKAWFIQNGNIVERDYFSLDNDQNHYDSYSKAVDDGCQILKTTITNSIKSFDAASVELSGGFDSRVILAVLLGDSTAKISALTLGTPFDKDYLIAQKISSIYSIEHKFINLQGMQDFTIEQIIDLAKISLLQKDLSVNALAHLVLSWVENQLNQIARFSGVNGEIVRGFYYTGQSDHTGNIKASIDQLMRWRILANEKINQKIFNPDIQKKGSIYCRKMIHGYFAQYPGSWLDKTDRFYLYQRMHRWAGAALSGASQSRPLVAPFFQKDFVSWAFKVPNKFKRNGKILADILRCLNPKLAKLPLADNTIPLEIINPTFFTKARKAITLSSKIVKKIGQQLKLTQNPSAGTSLLATKLGNYWKDTVGIHDWIAGYPELQRDYILNGLENKKIIDIQTLSFILNLSLLDEIKHFCKKN